MNDKPIKNANNEKPSSDPFYSEENMEFLRHGVSELNAGKGTEHELIDENDKNKEKN